VHGGVGVGIEVGEAGEAEASQATQHEGAVVFIGGSDTVESLVYGTNLALETDKSEEGSRNAPYSVDERLSNNVTDGWQLRDGLIPVALLRVEPAFPVQYPEEVRPDHDGSEEGERSQRDGDGAVLKFKEG